MTASGRDERALWPQRLLAGGLAGIVSRTLTAPLERLKLQRQVSSSAHAQAVSAREAFARSVQREGFVSAAWRGNGTNCAKVFPATAVRFCAFEECLAALRRRQVDTQQWTARIGCGAFAGVAALTATYPLDVLRTRFSVDAHYGVAALRRDGARSLYRGLATSMASVVPFTTINFATYETMRQRALERGIAVHGVAATTMGALSGCAAMTVMYPVDVVRHRVMAQRSSSSSSSLATTRGPSPMAAVAAAEVAAGAASSSSSTTTPKFAAAAARARANGSVTAPLPPPPPPLNGRQMATHMWRTEGWRSFYRGLAISYAKVAPTVALTWTVYEWFRARWHAK